MRQSLRVSSFAPGVCLAVLSLHPAVVVAQSIDAGAQLPIVTSADAGNFARRTTLEAIVRRASAPRDEILGWDTIRNKLIVVERMPSDLPGFAHVAITEVSDQPGPQQRTWLTTAVDITSIRGSTDPLNAATLVDQRVRNDIAAARAKVSGGVVIPISEPLSACERSPFSSHTVSLEDNRTITTTVSGDGMTTSVVLSAGARHADTVGIPSSTLSTATGPINIPYNRLMDLRELPGTDRLAALVRSDACLPDGEIERVRAVMLPGFPVAEHPLVPLARGNLDERTALRAIAPRARIRTRDGQTGYFEGNTRIVYNDSWMTPDNKILVQYTRRDPNLSPLLAEQGHAQARFVIVEPRGRRFVALHEVVPPLNEDVFEGTSREAFSVDMDGDGRAELFIRAKYNPGSEVTSMFRWADGALQYMWRGQTQLDERSSPLRATAEVRHCDMGVDGQVLVMRCRVEQYAAHVPEGTLPTTVERIVQRVRSNGGAVSIVTERR